ncbi:hypothetical protein ACH44C_34445 [Streptomyces purpureus]|uniref:DUF6197 family protein n=1 Tax=Streptomyces purpureus TaxID=1951 RepID=UPI0037880DB5
MTDPIAVALTARLRTAGTYMTEHGWTQGIEQNDLGQVCLTGAIRLCAPQTGDESLIRAVLRHQNRAEDWNDTDGRTADEVLSVLTTVEITDADLEATFGPQWAGVVCVVRQAATLTAKQAETIYVAWAAAGDATWDAAWGAARAATLATWAARDARAAAGGAARAEVVRHLITPEQYNALTAPWRAAFPTP